ncbi:hypothetical protein CLOSTHATH_02033 [Hungatella hathewayi DSM 13479]|uniref:Uncharacterized protein n=1 Tax=Hungatella hathewayi DSM 13479 TaxID=566550 RepID=D3AEJ9_9FIRM|nr:hypothetical protein CLOSTHATH_02033 [Hungatella hathewayi DSM 13479]
MYLRMRSFIWVWGECPTAMGRQRRSMAVHCGCIILITSQLPLPNPHFSFLKEQKPC